MSTSSLFPTAVEIKRILAAVQRSGVDIGKIEVEPARIRIFLSMDTDVKTTAEQAYDSWLRGQGSGGSKTS